ncbi:MAG: hypothetical protein M3Y52_07930 [Actinomycetota bacterium]|nr:hypothetical protein [Actinomycetota bacterium]
MHDTDPISDLIRGLAVTPEKIDAARRHLVMLSSLADEVRGTVPTLVPPGSGAWRSEASGRYADGLDELRGRLFAARDELTDAVYSLEERIRRMQAELDEQAASAGVAR